MSEPGGLGGRGILLLRPEALAAALARRISERGGEPLIFPVMEIRPPPDLARLAGIIDRLDQASLAIFISPTAVERGMAHVRMYRDWPEGVRVAAVGPATASALERRGFRDVIVSPEGADSEALVALPELASMRESTVVIFRGEGGRPLLGDTLAERGARVEYAECYRRVRPEGVPGELVMRIAQGYAHAVCVWSAEAWENGCALLGAAPREGDETSALERFRALPVFVPHERIAAQIARSGGAATVLPGGDAPMIEGMERFFAKV